MTEHNPPLTTYEKTYDSFKQAASIAQALKNIIRGQTPIGGSKFNSDWMSDEEKEALDLICTEIARISAGAPEVKDHWTAIAAYVKLVLRAYSK